MLNSNFNLKFIKEILLSTLINKRGLNTCFLLKIKVLINQISIKIKNNKSTY